VNRNDLGPPRGRRVAASLVGAGLLLAAAIAIWMQRDALVESWVSIEDPPVWAILVLPLSTIGSLAIGTILLRSLLRDIPDLDQRDLAALVASSTLFNLLPLKVGLVGRAAWQRRHQQVPIGRSVLVAVQMAGLTAAAIVLAVAAIVLAGPSGIPLPAIWASLAGGLLGLGLLPHRGLGRGETLARFGALLGWRVVDVAIWSVRFVAGFAVIGIAIDPGAALALACVAAATGLVPVVGTTLGVREWVVALVAPMLAGIAWDQALAAELLARGVEVATVAVVGGVATWWLWRRSFVRSERPGNGRAPSAS
jgi:hypothetical protein